MTREDIYKKLNCEIFKVEDSPNSINCFVLYDKNLNIFQTDISLISLFDIITTKYIKLVFELFLLSLPDSEGKSPNRKGLYNNSFKDWEKYSYIELKELIINLQKPVFKEFKDLVLIYKQNINGFDIVPNNKLLIKRENKVYLNLYQPLIDFDKIPLKTEREFPHIERLLKNILGEGYEFFLKFLAWKIQRPLDIIPNHWIIQDDGGTGKTQILGSYILSKIFNCSIIGQEELESPYTDYLKNKVFIIAEEIEGFSNEKKIKRLTGADKITIREVYKPSYTITNYNNWIILSNDIKPLKISLNDRRFNVVGGGFRLSPDSSGDWGKTLFGTKEENFKFFKGFHKDINKEIRRLIGYLKTLKLTRQELQQTLTTKHKTDLEEINSTSEHIFINEIISLGLDNFARENVKNGNITTIMNSIININKKNYIKSNSIYNLYTDFCKCDNLKPLTKMNFFKRLPKTKYYHKIFSDKKLISSEGKKFQVLGLKNKLEVD